MKNLDVQWNSENATTVEISHRDPAPKRDEVPVALQSPARAVSRKVIVITPDGAMMRQCIRAT